MNWRDGLRVNNSKKITTNRQTKREKRKRKEKKGDSSNKTTSIWPTNCHILCLILKACCAIIFIFQIILLWLVAISHLMYKSSKFKCFVNVQMTWEPKISFYEGKQKLKVFPIRHAIIQLKILYLEFVKITFYKNGWLI